MRPLYRYFILLLLLSVSKTAGVRAQEADPKMQRYEELIAQSYRLIDENKSDSAILMLKQAIDLVPEAPTNYMLQSNLSEIYLAQRDTTTALLHLNEAIEHQKDLIPLRERRAEIYGKLGRWQAALADCDYIVSLNPTRERSLFTRALLKTDMKLYDGAADDLSTIILNNDKAYLPRIALAKVEILRHAPDKAEKIYNYLIATWPDIPVAYRERIRLFISQDRKALALKDARTLINEGKHVTAEDYLLRGRIWELYGEKREARKDYEKAKEMGATEQDLKEVKDLKSGN